jgi:uncharacterized membrane protein YkvA (DUF1232 family)
MPGGNGVFRTLSLRVRLILRLMVDRRVNPLIKLIPLASLAYLIIPDLVLGPLDDAAVVGLAGYIFVELCPPEVVKEHMDRLTSVVEGSYRELDDDQPGKDG